MVCWTAWSKDGVNRPGMLDSLSTSMVMWIHLPRSFRMQPPFRQIQPQTSCQYTDVVAKKMQPTLSVSQNSPRRAIFLDELVICLPMPLAYAALINFEKAVLIN
jgi:hypothetical protein